MQTLTHTQLADKLLTHHGTIIVTLSALTPVKAPRFPLAVFKVARVNGVCGAVHSHIMERADSTYQAGSRSWGVRLNRYLVKHVLSGKLYLTLKVEHEYDTIYVARQEKGLRPMKAEQIAPFLPKPDTRAAKTRDYSLLNIKRISLDGEKYRVVPDKVTNPA